MDREKGHILFPKGSQSESFNSNISDSDFLHKTKHNMTSIITGLKKGDLQRKIQRAQLVEPEKKVKDGTEETIHTFGSYHWGPGRTICSFCEHLCIEKGWENSKSNKH